MLPVKSPSSLACSGGGVRLLRGLGRSAAVAATGSLSNMRWAGAASGISFCIHSSSVPCRVQFWYGVVVK